jgi:phage portal protein BeeE
LTLTHRVRNAWHALNSAAPAPRKTQLLPAVFTPYQRPGQATVSKPTAANLRRFAEMPIARRAINLVKDQIASMDWQIRIRRGIDPANVPDADARIAALRCALEEPNRSDSFRTLWEQVLEDILVGGFGAVEMRITGDSAAPFELFAVDGAQIQLDPRWNGDPDTPRFGFATGRQGVDSVTPMRDDELMYLRLNPRTHTSFGLGRVEVAFEAIGQFLAANRYAGRLAANSAAQYALWLNDATPEQHDRVVRWWQDEVEGTGKVPILSCESKPEILRFSGGTDADLRLAWQQFLIRIIADAFDLPPMLLGLENDVTHASASTLADDAFRSAVVPVAKLLAEHITRDIFAKLLGFREFEFCFNALETRDEQKEVNMQLQLLNAGVLSVAEVRAMRGLAPVLPAGNEVLCS